MMKQIDEVFEWNQFFNISKTFAFESDKFNKNAFIDRWLHFDSKNKSKRSWLKMKNQKGNLLLSSNHQTKNHKQFNLLKLVYNIYYVFKII